MTVGNLVACFIFVLEMESGLDLEGLKQRIDKVNYPQWVTVLEIYGWNHAKKMHQSDRSALFPLNLTLNRIEGVMIQRKKQFLLNGDIAKEARNVLELPSTMDLQLTALATSNLAINWENISDEERKLRYKSLWVGFSGTLWKNLEDKRLNDDNN